MYKLYAWQNYPGRRMLLSPNFFLSFIFLESTSRSFYIHYISSEISNHLGIFLNKMHEYATKEVINSMN